MYLEIHPATNDRSVHRAGNRSGFDHLHPISAVRPHLPVTSLNQKNKVYPYCAHDLDSVLRRLR